MQKALGACDGQCCVASLAVGFQSLASTAPGQHSKVEPKYHSIPALCANDLHTWFGADQLRPDSGSDSQQSTGKMVERGAMRRRS